MENGKLTTSRLSPSTSLGAVSVSNGSTQADNWTSGPTGLSQEARKISTGAKSSVRVGTSDTGIGKSIR